MATVGEVIEKLKREKEHLAWQRDQDLSYIDSHVKSGGEGAKNKVRSRYFDSVEVIDYVLNFLESEEEEPCPD